MNSITNIKINYMILEQILRVTGTYKNLCDEYKNLHGIFAEEYKDAKKDKDAEEDKNNGKKYFIREHDILDELFKLAKTGDINSLFGNDTARDIVLEFIINFTGVPLKYWLGEERIKLDIVRDLGENESLHLDDASIDTVDLSKDGYDKNISESAYHGVLYQEQLKNPLHLDYEGIYLSVSRKEEASDDEIEEAENIVESLYSLKGLLKVLLLNMTGEIELIDKSNISKADKWKPYINELKEPTEHGITYCPKFIEIRNEPVETEEGLVETEEGLVQTIIRNIFDLGYVFTFRDELKKKFKIKVPPKKLKLNIEKKK